MSRYIAQHRTNVEISFHYGFDRVCGYFFQRYDTSSSVPELPVEERDSWKDGLTGPEMAETLVVADVPEEHFFCMTRDAPF